MRHDFVLVLADNQVFQVERWCTGLPVAALSNLQIEPNVLVDFELEDLRLLGKSMFTI